jgi:MFS family permease
LEKPNQLIFIFVSFGILGMWQLFIGSTVLSIIHALIPNHWIPLVAIGKSQKWSTGETVIAAGIAGFAHTLSTVIIGILVGFAGYTLSGQFELITSIIAPAVLVAFGVGFLIYDYFKGHSHHLESITDKDQKNKKKSKWAILGTLSIAMFFSPCFELEAYYFHAGTFGWPGIFLVSMVYLIVPVALMMILVFLGLQGAKHIRSKFLEHHERRVTGIVLILLGIVAYFVEF